MKFLVDNAISPFVSRELSRAGYDALHVRDLGMAASSDEEILECARVEERVVISADTDFGTLLTLRRQASPSFLLLRGGIERHPASQAAALLRELPGLTEHLRAGAIVVVTRSRIRIRRLSPEE